MVESKPCGGKCGGCRKSEDEKDSCEERPCHEGEIYDKDSCDGCDKNTEEID